MRVGRILGECLLACSVTLHLFCARFQFALAVGCALRFALKIVLLDFEAMQGGGFAAFGLAQTGQNFGG